MKLVRAEALGSFDDYHLVDVPTPSPKPGEVLIRVHACSVGYVDALLAVGGYQVKPPTPYTPGSDIAGVVEAVGEGADASLVGVRVLAPVYGGFAEFVVTPARNVTRIGDGVGFEAASAFRLNYATALYGLKDRAVLQPGETLLVTGGAGGVGSAAVDIGRLLGAEVIAVASTAEKRDFATARGAQHVLDTQTEGWRDRLKAITGGKAVDVVFDPVCGPLFEAAFRSLNWKGRHLVVGFVGGPIPALPSNLTLMKGAALVGVDIRQFPIFEPQLAARNTEQLMAWLADGTLDPAVGRTFPFPDFRAALAHAMSGQGLGKTVLQIA
jgi:NADPH2:quinone reductase